MGCSVKSFSDAEDLLSMVLDKLEAHKTAINELGEREHDMSAQFDAAHAAWETFMTNALTAVSTLQVSVQTLEAQLTAAASNNPDAANLEALTTDINNQIANLAAMLTPATTTTTTPTPAPAAS